jgi:hypothetical protein
VKHRTHLIIAALAMSLACTARGQLGWEQTEVELHPKDGDAQAVGTFHYQNKGDKPVHIMSVHTSCGCTTAGKTKDIVAPGEKGEITATFNIGDRTGTQQKTVTVQTDDPKQPSTVLTLRAVITPGFELQPALVFWQIGEEPKAKTIVAKSAADKGVKNIAVTSSSPDFATKVEPGGAAGEFRITVTPRDTSKTSAATLSIKPDNANAKTYYASARITPAAVR